MKREGERMRRRRLIVSPSRVVGRKRVFYARPRRRISILDSANMGFRPEKFLVSPEEWLENLCGGGEQ